MFAGTILCSINVDSKALHNQPPLAEIVSITPNPAPVGTNISFIGRGYDPENGTKIFSWDFNNDDIWEVDRVPVGGPGWQYQYSNFTYTSPGLYFVLLKVEDIVGAYAEDYKVVTITSDTTPPRCFNDSMYQSKTFMKPGEPFTSRQ